MIQEHETYLQYLIRKPLSGSVVIISVLLMNAVIIPTVFLFLTFPYKVGINLKSLGIRLRRLWMGKKGLTDYKYWAKTHCKHPVKYLQPGSGYWFRGLYITSSTGDRAAYFEYRGYPFQTLSKILCYPMRRIRG